MPFIREVTPRFSQLDPAGILFFGEVFTICSGVYEDFLSSLGFDWDGWFRSPDAASPVKHAEAEYFKPLEGGQTYEVRVEILKMSTSAFEVGYIFQRLGIHHCYVRLVHVFIDTQGGAKIPIPASVREAFNRYGVRPALEAPSGAVSPAASAESV